MAEFRGKITEGTIVPDRGVAAGPERFHLTGCESRAAAEPMMAWGLALPESSSHDLELRFADQEALLEEFENNLRYGRSFAAGAGGLAEREVYRIALVHPDRGDVFELDAEVVFAKEAEPGRGLGLEIRNFDEDLLAKLEAFAKGPKNATPREDVNLRVRRYSTAEQMRAARDGDLPERVALERAYGKAVWELLLQNRRITAPEVTRIARKGNAPAALLDTIAGNAAWLASGELRRALLGNSRLGATSRDKVLRTLPKAELTLVSRQAGYPIAVRQAAKKIQGR